MSNNTSPASADLRATYLSPASSKHFQHTILAPRSGSEKIHQTQAKIEYLSKLRASTKTLQEEINKFLTEKMDEDKIAAGQEAVAGTSKPKTEDEAEEANYGEEVLEDET